MEATSETNNRLRSDGVVEEYLQCPTCECKLQHWEVKSHFEQEMERLRQSQIKAVSKANVESSQQSASNAAALSEERRKPWTIFQQVQRNRHTRLKRRTSKRNLPTTTQACPVCNDVFSFDEIQQHAERCLRQSNGTSNGRDGGSSSNEDDDTEEYEEYEWAGQKRIRVSSLLQGGYAGAGIGQSVTNNIGSGNQNNNQADEEDEEDLKVDEDDTQIYGPVQYAESYVIPPNSEHNDDNEDDNDVTNYMRRLITGTDTPINNSNDSLELPRTNNTNATTTTTETCIPQTGSTTTRTPTNPRINTKKIFSNNKQTNYSAILESLKSKLRSFENQAQNKFKCLICLDDYKNPAISVACWHVHCEECWLRSLGARKLCPQCNLITTPKDLRRIYM